MQDKIGAEREERLELENARKYYNQKEAPRQSLETIERMGGIQKLKTIGGYDPILETNQYNKCASIAGLLVS
jgi:hypothetical protein